MGGRVATKEGPESRTVVLPLAQPYAYKARVTESRGALSYWTFTTTLLYRLH